MLNGNLLNDLRRKDEALIDYSKAIEIYKSTADIYYSRSK